MPSNLICILADDHRASALGHAGAEPVDTPSLDALAAAGCRFPQLRIEGGRCRAVCIPTRASLITGCSVVTACADPEGRTLKADAPLLPALLRRRGYHCEHIGKWHQDLAALRRGFDHGRHVFTAGMADHHALPVHAWEDLASPEIPPPRILPQYSSEAFADEAVAFLGERARQGGTPFFLQLALTLPHDPFDPPPGWSEPHEADWPPLPPDFQPRHPFDIGDLEVRDEQLLPWPRPEREVRRMAARYHAMIAAIDAVVGRIVQTLQRTGLAGNTLLLYTGDHGLAGGRHGLLGKQNLYDCSLRIPGILAGPGVPADSWTSPRPCSTCSGCGTLPAAWRAIRCAHGSKAPRKARRAPTTSPATGISSAPSPTAATSSSPRARAGNSASSSSTSPTIRTSAATSPGGAHPLQSNGNLSRSSTPVCARGAIRISLRSTGSRRRGIGMVRADGDFQRDLARPQFKHQDAVCP